MEELHLTAKAYYIAGCANLKQAADEFFRAIDFDGNGRVSLHEYLSFMRREGYTQMNNAQIFKEINKNGSGYLDVNEVMTLYYIINSGRPICDGCGTLIKGLFFTCMECFNCVNDAFSVCPSCYCNGKFAHKHRQFLDNFTLLELTRKDGLSKVAGGGTDMHKHKVQAMSELHTVTCASNAVISTSLDIVPASPRPKKVKWKMAALKALETGVGLGNIASNLCTIL